MTNLYLINGVKAIIHEGRIYIEATPFMEQTQQIIKRIKRGPKPESAGGGAVKKRKERVRLEPEDIKQIKEMIVAEYPVHEIATKFELSDGYIYQLKVKMKKSGELKYDEKV